MAIIFGEFDAPWIEGDRELSCCGTQTDLRFVVYQDDKDITRYSVYDRYDRLGRVSEIVESNLICGRKINNGYRVTVLCRICASGLGLVW